MLTLDDLSNKTLHSDQLTSGSRCLGIVRVEMSKVMRESEGSVLRILWLSAVARMYCFQLLCIRSDPVKMCPSFKETHFLKSKLTVSQITVQLTSLVFGLNCKNCIQMLKKVPPRVPIEEYVV